MTATALVLACLVILLIAGCAVAYVIGAATTVAYIATGHGRYLAELPQRIFSQLDIFALMAMPLFILTGELMNRGGVTRALVDLAMSMAGRVRGGLGYVNVLTALFFSGISGSAMADAAALSSTLVPAMRERGYSAGYAGAITGAAAILGPIVPPSIILLFYGAIMGVDVAALFAAGLGPGALLALALLLVNFIAARVGNHPGGRDEPVPRMAASLRTAAPALAVPAVIIGGIVLGWMTPTEAAGVAVLAAVLVGAWYRALPGSQLIESLKRTVVMSGSIFILMAAAAGIGYLAALTGTTAQVAEFFARAGLSGTSYLLVITLLFFLIGIFLDVQIALVLAAPVMVPIAIAQGADPVHIGVTVCLTLSIGLISPPLGGVMLVISAVTGTEYWRLVRATLPLLAVELVVLIAVVLVPGISLYIPRALGLLHR